MTDNSTSLTDMPQSVYRYIFRKTFWQQVVVIGLTLSLLPLAPIPLELQRRLLDDAVAKGDTDLLIQLSIYYLIALLVGTGLKMWMRIQREMISVRVVHALRTSVYYCIYTVIPSGTRSKQAKEEHAVNEGAVVSMLASEVEKLGGFAGSAISGPLLQLGTLVAVLGYMFWIEPVVAGIALTLYSPQLIIVPLFQKRLNRLSGDKAIEVRKLGAFIVNNDDEDLMSKEPPKPFFAITDRIMRLRMRFLLTKNSMKTINNLLIALGPFGVIAYGGSMAINGQIEVGVILAFVSGLERLGAPIRDLIGSYSQITDAMMRYKILLNSFPDHFANPKK